MYDGEVEATCDWLTGTSGDEQVKASLASLWWLIKDHHHISKVFVKKSSQQGYIGERIDHAFYGEREDGACLVLSGPLAAQHAFEAINLGARPSRLDLQVTGTVSTKPSHAVGEMFDQAKNFKPANGRAPQLKMFVNRHGPEGLYVGRRASEVMLRAYDKGTESRNVYYAGCLRCEVELKAGSARQYGAAWTSALEPEEYVGGIVKSLYAARGITLPFEVQGEEVVLRKTSYATPVESKMAWLLKQVSPTVQALIEEIGQSAVASVLFPDSLDKQQDNDVSSS